MTDPERSAEHRSHRELLGGAAAVLGLQFLGLALNFGLQVFLARSLGATQYGTYVYALRWLGLLALLCQGGLAVGSLRYVPAYATTGDDRLLRGFLGASWRFVVLTAAVVGGLAWATAAGLGGRLAPEMRATLAVALLALPFYALLQVWSSSLRGLGRVVLSQLPSPVLRPLLLALGVAGWLAAGATLTAPAAMICNLGAVAVLTAVAGVWLRRAVPAPAEGLEPRYRFAEWRRVMPPLMVQNLLGMAVQRLDVLLIGALLGVREVALYAAASRIAGLVVFGRKAVNAWAAPEISRLHARGEPAALGRLARRAARTTCGLSIPIALALVAASRPVLSAFGSEFAAAGPVLLILVAGHLLASTLGPAGFLLMMTGGEKTVVRISAVTVVVSAGLLLGLIPAYGLAGAAVAAGATRFGYHLGLLVAAERRTGIRAAII